MPAITDIKGQRYGSLLVESYRGIEKRKATWNCVCECGNKTIVTYGNLKYGITKSCGDYIHRVKHDMCDTRIYRIWKNMKNRCDSPGASHYYRYGGRGISYSNEWKEFKGFYEWAKNNGYTDDLTIDRIDNDGNYEPNNCRWVTQKTQMSNTKSNVYVEVDGENRTITEWSEVLGIHYATLRNRYRLGDRGKRFTRPLETKYSSNY